MSLSVCPAAVVAAPAEVVWGILMQPAKYGEWIDGQRKQLFKLPNQE